LSISALEDLECLFADLVGATFSAAFMGMLSIFVMAPMLVLRK
jgi:hypothetical protein